MGKRRLSEDGMRRYHLALKLCEGKKDTVEEAVAIALSDLDGLAPYESASDEHHIKLHLRQMVVARLNWEERLRTAQ